MAVWFIYQGMAEILITAMRLEKGIASETRTKIDIDAVSPAPTFQE
ncbi:MAG: hypothetical protein K9J42_02320 [Sulfuritalea sp.]|nr:hypothetical protein [Sulfuritalea sp.]